ncbi:MAG: ABC transporter substrate-binding protein [Proteobacteria bacterium]|nr:ABC transporter substrate-binding protein [Pseudomonadota bacterium]
MIKFINMALLLMVPFVATGAQAEAPRRIVSLKPAITDTVYALGLGDKLVGVTKYCDVPEGASRPQIAADYTRPYTERIISLRPDLVLGSEENSSRRSIEAIERAGIAVRLFPFTGLDESLASIHEIAELLGRPDRGKMLTSDMKSQLDTLKRRYGAEKPAKAVVVWGLRPMIVAGPGTYMHEAIPCIGLANAATAAGVKYPKVGLEQLIAYDPEVIIDLSMDVRPGAAPERPWDGVKAIKAVRQGRVIAMDPGIFRAGPGIALALEMLAKEIYGK